MVQAGLKYVNQIFYGNNWKVLDDMSLTLRYYLGKQFDYWAVPNAVKREGKSSFLSARGIEGCIFQDAEQISVKEQMKCFICDIGRGDEE